MRSPGRGVGMAGTGAARKSRASTLPQLGDYFPARWSMQGPCWGWWLVVGGRLRATGPVEGGCLHPTLLAGSHRQRPLATKRHKEPRKPIRLLVPSCAFLWPQIRLREHPQSREQARSHNQTHNLPHFCTLHSTFCLSASACMPLKMPKAGSCEPASGVKGSCL